MQITGQTVLFVLTVIGGAMGIIGFFQKRYTPVEIAAIRGEVEILKKQMALFWAVIEKNMSTLLHSPHRPILDRLLEKNQMGVRLTDDEAQQLVDLLQKLIDSQELSRDELGFANMLLAVTVAKYGVKF